MSFYTKEQLKQQLAETRRASAATHADSKQRKTFNHVEQIDAMFAQWHKSNMFQAKAIKHLRSLLAACNCQMDDDAIIEYYGMEQINFLAQNLVEHYELVAKSVFVIAQAADSMVTPKVEESQTDLLGKQIAIAIRDRNDDEVARLTKLLTELDTEV